MDSDLLSRVALWQETSPVNIPQIEACAAELLALFLLILGGVRLILHEWRQIFERPPKKRRARRRKPTLPVAGRQVSTST